MFYVFTWVGLHGDIPVLHGAEANDFDAGVVARRVGGQVYAEEYITDVRLKWAIRQAHQEAIEKMHEKGGPSCTCTICTPR